MENATSKQVALLVKLGLNKSEAEKLTKKEASLKIKELMAKQIESETSSSTETSKKTKTKSKKSSVETKEQDTTKQETKSVNYETSNGAIDSFCNALKKDKDFISKKLVQESKIDELSIFIYNYALKNKDNNCFMVDTESESFIELCKKFNETPFETLMSDLCGSKQVKETTEKVETPKKTATKKTNKKATEKVEIETKTETKVLSDYEQLCLNLGI